MITPHHWFKQYNTNDLAPSPMDPFGLVPRTGLEMIIYRKFGRPEIFRPSPTDWCFTAPIKYPKIKLRFDPRRLPQ